MSSVWTLPCEDFTIETSNKQLNFLQHILTVLKPGGRAGVVLPDNCLFEGKAGEVFEILTQDCNVHTVLRLPRGTFTPYSQGVKANVVFFQTGYATEAVWIFDARSNVPGITKKDRPLTPQHFAEFEAAYGSDPIGTEFITEEGSQNSSAKLCRPGSVIVVVRSGILKHILPVAIVGQPLAINQDLLSALILAKTI